jgi:hypothetical protein
MKEEKNGLVLFVPHNLRMQKVGKISRYTKCNRVDTVANLLPDTSLHPHVKPCSRVRPASSLSHPQSSHTASRSAAACVAWPKPLSILSNPNTRMVEPVEARGTAC